MGKRLDGNVAIVTGGSRGIGRAIDARAPLILCRESLPLLGRAPAGCIVNISSVVGVKGYPLRSAYTASGTYRGTVWFHFD